MRVPRDHPVQPLRRGSRAFAEAKLARTLATCGTCNRSWNDGQVTSITPAPSGRCPFEYQHRPAKRAA